MKKLYALLSLAAVAVSATAAVPMSAELPQLPRHSFQTAELQNVAAPQAESLRMHKAPAKAAAATSATDLTGVYLGESFSLRSNSAGGSNVGWQVDGLAAFFDVDGTVTISGLWDESIELTGGVFDPESQTISFSPQDPGVSGGGYNVYLSILDLATNTLLDDEIVFNVDVANRNIYYTGSLNAAETHWASCLVIAALDPSTGQYVGGFDFLAYVDYNQVNAYVQYSYFEDETATEPTETYDFIYTEIKDSDLVCYNLLGGGFSSAVPFTVNATARTATCVDGIFTVQSDGTNWYPFYLCDVEISGEQVSLSSTTVETDIIFGDDGEGGTITGLIKDYVAAVCDYNGQILPWIGDGLLYNFAIVYTGDLLADMAGVEDITIDVDNSNAPVEYFNLQGQRVANPAAGQVYIRRQGTAAAKVRF